MSTSPNSPSQPELSSTLEEADQLQHSQDADDHVDSSHDVDAGADVDGDVNVADESVDVVVDGDDEVAAAAEGEGNDAAEATEEAEETEEQFMSRLSSSLSSLVCESPAEHEWTMKEIKSHLKPQFHKHVFKQYKDFIRSHVSDLLSARLSSVGGAVSSSAMEAIGEVETSDDERTNSKRKRKRTRVDNLQDDSIENMFNSDDDGMMDEGAAPPDEQREEEGSDYEERPKKKRRDEKKEKKSKDKKKSSSSLPSIPKPLSALQLYYNSARSQVQGRSPSLSGGELKKVLSDEWKALTPDERAEWEQAAKQEKQQYKHRLNKLKEEDPHAYDAFIKEQEKKERESKKTKRSDVSTVGGPTGDEEAPKQLSYFDSIVAQLKTRRQTKSEYSEEDQKLMAEDFLMKMNNAAQRDEQHVKQGKPAVEKLNMLDDVLAQLSKRAVADLLLDAGLLRTLNVWLKPEGVEGTLPNIKLRSTIYKILDSLHVDETLLSNSDGLGKRIMKYWKHSEETSINKKLLDKMIQKWMRPMLGLSTDYKHLAEVEEKTARQSFYRKKMLNESKGQAYYNPKRAVIPESAHFDYAIRPQGDKDNDAELEEMEARTKKPEGRKEEMKKRLERMRRSAAVVSKPRFKVDITGRASLV